MGQVRERVAEHDMPQFFADDAPGDEEPPWLDEMRFVGAGKRRSCVADTLVVRVYQLRACPERPRSRAWSRRRRWTSRWW